MLLMAFICFFGLMTESNAMQKGTFIDAVCNGSFDGLEKRLSLLTDETEKELAQEFKDLYWDSRSKSNLKERSTSKGSFAALRKLGDDGGDVFQAAEFVARYYFVKMQEDMFSVQAAKQAVQWLERVHSDGENFRNYKSSRDGASLRDLLLVAQAELFNRESFQSKLDESKGGLETLIEKVERGSDSEIKAHTLEIEKKSDRRASSSRPTAQNSMSRTSKVKAHTSKIEKESDRRSGSRHPAAQNSMSRTSKVKAHTSKIEKESDRRSGSRHPAAQNSMSPTSKVKARTPKIEKGSDRRSGSRCPTAQNSMSRTSKLGSTK